MSINFNKTVDLLTAIKIANVITGIENSNNDYQESEEKLIDVYGIKLSSFQQLLNSLSNFMDFGICSTTNVPYMGFSKDNVMLLKKEISSEFFEVMTQLLIRDENLEELNNGVSTLIQIDEVPKYIITVNNYSEDK